LTPSARRGLRVTLVAGEAATVLVTWPLWQARSSPPNLPALPGLPALDMGAALLAALLLVLVAPRWGLPLHLAVLVAAMGLDQLRIQPQLVSFALLLCATGPAPRETGDGTGALVARCHLVALYLWAGLHKLLSAEYVDSAARFWQRAAPALGPELARALAVGVAVFEVGLALAVAWPVTRRSAGWLAGAMHFAIFLSLSPLGRGRNESVWPWNLALAVAAPLLLTTWRTDWRTQLARPAAVALALVLLLSPALYYLGRLDAYLAWCLYSVNVPVAILVRSEQREQLAAAGATTLRLPDLNSTIRELSVPFPPAQRLFEQYFERVARPGDELHVYDPRGWAARRGLTERVLTWPR
jgi:uncharacterized membrane protein YphA (DoxX/SURF4 family)